MTGKENRRKKQNRLIPNVTPIYVHYKKFMNTFLQEHFGYTRGVGTGPADPAVAGPKF